MVDPIVIDLSNFARFAFIFSMMSLGFSVLAAWLVLRPPKQVDITVKTNADYYRNFATYTSYTICQTDLTAEEKVKRVESALNKLRGYTGEQP